VKTVVGGRVKLHDSLSMMLLTVIVDPSSHSSAYVTEAASSPHTFHDDDVAVADGDDEYDKQQKSSLYMSPLFDVVQHSSMGVQVVDQVVDLAYASAS